MMLRRGVGGLYVNGVVARYQRSGTPAAAISLRGDQTWDRYENGLMLQQAAAGFVTPTAYRGAADPDGARWWEGWTYYAQN